MEATATPSDLLTPLVAEAAAGRFPPLSPSGVKAIQEDFDQRKLLYEKADEELRAAEHRFQHMQDTMASFLAAHPSLAPASSAVASAAPMQSLRTAKAAGIPRISVEKRERFRAQAVPKMGPFPTADQRGTLKTERVSGWRSASVADEPHLWTWIVPLAAAVAGRVLCWVLLRAAAYQAFHITVHAMSAADGGKPRWPAEAHPWGDGLALAWQGWVPLVAPVVYICLWAAATAWRRDLQRWTRMLLCVMCMDVGSALVRVVAVLPPDSAMQDCQSSLGNDFLKGVSQPFAAGIGVDWGAVWSVAFAPGAACLDEIYPQLPWHSALFALGVVDILRQANRVHQTLFVSSIGWLCVALQLVEFATQVHDKPHHAACHFFAVPLAILCHSNVILAFVARHWARGSPKDGLSSLERLDNGCYFEASSETLQPGGDLSAPWCFVPFCCFAGAEHHLMSLRGPLPTNASQEERGRFTSATHTDAVPPHRRVTTSSGKRMRLNGETAAQMRHASRMLDDGPPVSPVNKSWVNETGRWADLKDEFVFLTTVIWLVAKLLVFGLPVALACVPPIGIAWLFAIVEAQNNQGLHHAEFAFAFSVAVLLSLPLLGLAAASLVLDVAAFYLLSVPYCAFTCRWHAMLHAREALAPYRGGPCIIWHLPDMFRALAGQCWRHGWIPMIHMVTCTVLVVPFVKYYVNSNPWIYNLKLRKSQQSSEELRAGSPLQIAGTCCDMLSSPRLPVSEPRGGSRSAASIMRVFTYMAPFYPKPPSDRRWSLGLQVGGRLYPGRALLVTHTTHGASKNGGSTEQPALSETCVAPVYRVMFWYSNPYHVMTGWSEVSVSSAAPGASRPGVHGLEHTTWLVSGCTKQTGDRSSWAGTGAALAVAEAWTAVFMQAFSVWPAKHAAV